MLFLQNFLVPFHLIALARGFQFQLSSPPTQCDLLTVTWSGGQPPFNLLIFKPYNGPIQNISIPSAAYQNSQGSFSTTLQVPQDRQVLFSMSDVTGIASGGISAVMTVGPSLSGTKCNITNPPQNFTFAFDSSIMQCKPYSFWQFNGATPPITVLVVIALGQAFILQAPLGDTFIWSAANITANSYVTFLMTDAVGHTGGSTYMLPVGFSDDASCISASTIGPFPPSLPSNTSPLMSSNTLTSKSSQTLGVNANPIATSQSSSHIGIIVGGTVEGLVALVLIISLLWCKRRKLRDSGRNAPWKMASTNELISPATHEGASHLQYSHYTATPSTFNHNQINEQRSAPQDNTHPSQVVAEEIMEVVELPPVYSEDRAPIPGFVALPNPYDRD